MPNFAHERRSSESALAQFEGCYHCTSCPCSSRPNSNKRSVSAAPSGPDLGLTEQFKTHSLPDPKRFLVYLSVLSRRDDPQELPRPWNNPPIRVQSEQPGSLPEAKRTSGHDLSHASHGTSYTPGSEINWPRCQMHVKIVPCTAMPLFHPTSSQGLPQVSGCAGRRTALSP